METPPVAPVVVVASDTTTATEVKATSTTAPKQKIKKKPATVATPPVAPVPLLPKPTATLESKLEIVVGASASSASLPIKKYYTNLHVALELDKFEPYAELTHYAVLHNLFECYKAMRKYIEYGFKPLDDVDVTLNQMITAFGAHAPAGIQPQLAAFARMLKIENATERDAIKAVYSEIKNSLTKNWQRV